MVASVPIIVIGYNRPKAMERLLNSLLKASYPVNVDLIISIDGGEEGVEVKKVVEVREVAENFAWPYGEKRLIFHETRLGLRNHVLSCGDLSRDYDGVIVLEDDLYVSPVFYQYSLQSFEFYKDDPKIAGISLYSHAYNETAQFPFVPLTDDSDVFFLQYASSWGQFWSREGWASFRDWYNSQDPGDKSPGKLPANIKLWPETSWKKYFISYIIRHDLYFVYPRSSLTTNFGDEGSNHRISENLFQVPLKTGQLGYRFISLDNSEAVYDAWCEMSPQRLKKLVPSLADKDFEVDLYGMKSGQDSGKDMFLSSRKCSTPIRTFGREMKPHEMNILADILGDYFSLGAKKDFQEKNYFLKLLKCHEKKELAYWYTIREYHFYKNRLLATERSSKPWIDLGFLFRKIFIMVNYTFRYFRK